MRIPRAEAHVLILLFSLTSFVVLPNASHGSAPRSKAQPVPANTTPDPKTPAGRVPTSRPRVDPKGAGGAVGVSVSPSSVAFGHQPVGVKSPGKAVTLTNTGSTTLHVLNISTAGPGKDGSDFAETDTCGTSLAGGSSCTVAITFMPLATGVRSGKLKIAGNALGSPREIPLSGTGGSPSASVSPSSLSFHPQPGDKAGCTQPVTLTNTGDAKMKIFAITLAGENSQDFAETGPKRCKASLAPGESCTIAVTFTPSARSERTAKLVIVDNASDSPQSVPLSGGPPCGGSNCLIYPMVSASYVGGTVFGMPFTKGGLLRLNPFQVAQNRVNGKLAMGQSNMVFAFKSRKSVPPPMANAFYDIIQCPGPKKLTDKGGAVCSALPAKCAGLKKLTDEEQAVCYALPAKGDGYCLIQIPYAEISVLSRARLQPAALSNRSAPYLAAVAGVVAGVFENLTLNHHTLVNLGIEAGSMIPLYYFFSTLPSRHENYIAVFVKKKEKKIASKVGGTTYGGGITISRDNGGRISTAKVSVKEKGQQAASPDAEKFFKKGDLLAFRINNSHNYFNIAMILIAKTGHEFVWENAKKGGSGSF